ncbi:GNAT family N-acetyltransferase [Erythrobacter rubeus]|uniref:N-acetyltransferase n=1 Tax=Erythrobacter rubeus TaxID=2760803 RepID=A0ABR8KUS8_9SPHN|nr:GNAT family N-acetyltransferase [Erythrobacter rubeus]MBD2843345.1 N-acetyltransferase [Erythrobacter rubeus]
MTDEAQVTITHHAQGQGGKYLADVAGESHQGYLEWEPKTGLPQETVTSDVRVATHTVVPDAIGGRGIAAQLVERLVADARKQGFKIDPRCSYVAAKFDQNPGWADLRA